MVTTGPSAPISADMADVFTALSRLSLEPLASVAFLGTAAETLRTRLGVAAVYFLRGTRGDWIEVAGSSAAAVRPPLPAHLAAEALDCEGPTSEAGWAAAPLACRPAVGAAHAEGMVLAVQLHACPCPLELVSCLASYVGALFCLAEERHRKVHEAQRLASMLSLCQEWYQATEMEPLLGRMAEAATALLGADRASIFLWDKPNHLLVGRPALGMAGGELRVPDDAGIVGEVIRKRAPRRIDATVHQGSINRSVDEETGYTTRTVLCVPLVTARGDCVGAFEVLNKRDGQFDEEDEALLVQLAGHAAQALDQTQQWEQLLDCHQKLIEQAAAGADLIGGCPQIEALRSSVSRIADTDLAVLLLGQNGTGKEVVARQLHFSSRRREKPFIAVNCAALSETLLESELFGHEKGAFTDAHEARAGKFEQASGGTLFLDEIGDMSAAGQAKLLRVLEDKKVVRVGGSASIHSDVRIVAATNQNLAELVKAGRFRKDLYFRLNVVMLELPPLVERGDDILLLAEHFLGVYCRSIGRRVPKLTEAARKKLLGHAWPGNVRELKNLMERLAYLSTGERIEADDLVLADPGATDRSLATISGPLCDATREFQVRYVERVLNRARGNMSEAARMLGLHRSNLYRKMRQLGMVGGEEEDEELDPEGERR